MTRARNQLISLEATPYYHCMSRCVRRAFLCGEDPVTGRNFDHRKPWLVERIQLLSSIFAIDVCAYAIMSNHYHLVLFINQATINSLNDDDIITRWGILFPGSVAKLKALQAQAKATETHQNGIEDNINNSAITTVINNTLNQWRQQLTDISWYMRCLNEHIARLANKEDHCKGRFWEGRFKSQALLDEHALLSCMAYVDLNPLRAKLSDTPEASDYTSIQQRLFTLAKRQRKVKRTQAQHQLIQRIQSQRTQVSQTQPKHDHHQDQDKTQDQNKNKTQDLSQSNPNLRQALKQHAMPKATLKPLDGSVHTPLENGIPFALQDYLELIDSTARIIRDDKPGFMNNTLPPILERLGLNQTTWLSACTQFERRFFEAAGTVHALDNYRQQRQHHTQTKHTEHTRHDPSAAYVPQASQGDYQYRSHQSSRAKWLRGVGNSRRLFG